jgi:hypothetical protein
MNYIAIRTQKNIAGCRRNITEVFAENGERVCEYPEYCRQPKFGSKHLTINGWAHPIKKWVRK